MSAVQTLTPEFVDTIPTAMSPGVLYLSIAYRTTGHLCCCGCGSEVVAPLAPAQWSMTFDGETVSMHPSIGNWALECQSHYVIRRNQVLWRRKFTPEEIVDNRAHDLSAIERYDAATTAKAAGAVAATAETFDRPSFWSRLARRWFA